MWEEEKVEGVSSNFVGKWRGASRRIWGCLGLLRSTFF
jgi:hypothetical protein